MTTDHLKTALKLAPMIERVHGDGHPELTRVRELTEGLAQAKSSEETARLFQKLRSVTSHYTVPADGCEAYTATYDALKAADAQHGGSQ